MSREKNPRQFRLPVTTYEKVKSDQNDLEGEQSDAHGDQSPCDAEESGLLVESVLAVPARFTTKNIDMVIADPKIFGISIQDLFNEFVHVGFGRGPPVVS